MGSRPLPAERLIQEAITIYKQRNDEVGLAGAYRVYASFFTSPAIEQWRKWYAEHGFLDEAATVDNRYAKSIEYFQKAAAIYTRYNRTDWLTFDPEIKVAADDDEVLASHKKRVCKDDAWRDG